MFSLGNRLTSSIACTGVWLLVLLVKVAAGFSPPDTRQVAAGFSPPDARQVAAGFSPADNLQDPAPASGKSTLTGVYTADQASAGEKTYGNICMGCHNLGSQSGQSFALKWKGRPLFDLYETINEKMPEDDPGSLTPVESVQLVAFLLKANGNPAGTTALSSDAAELKMLVIEVPNK